MNKNLVIFFALSVSIYAGWMFYISKRYPHLAEDRARAAALAMKKAPATAVTTSAAPSAAAAPAKAVMGKPAKALPASVKEERVTVKTDSMEVELSSAGAKAVSWKLLAYREHNALPEPVQLLPGEGDYGAFDLPGTELDKSLWRLETKQPQAQAGGSQLVSFSAVVPSTQLTLRKSFSFDKAGFTVRLRLEILNGGSQAMDLSKSWLIWGPGIGLPQAGQAAASNGGAAQMEGKLDRVGLGDPKAFNYPAPRWVAVKNHYFVAAFINDAALPEAELRRETLDGVSKTVSAALGLGPLTLKPGESKVMETRLYAGPQDYGILKSFNNNLSAVIQFSFQWLSPLSVFLLSVMKFLFAFTRNWGVAIILLTVLVKLALFYPTHRGMVSSRRMQTQMAKMAPVLESLKKTYKDDPAKLQQETMRLYKEHGVNPLSGCFLMLPQMFIMISLYGALNGAFELRGAGFLGPWRDLSAPDPTFILVPLMGASMWLQQKLAPVNTASMNEDQAQMQKMMTVMMPIMFTVMGFIFKWPTGLLLYWSVSNVFGIGQQWYVNKTVR